MSEYGLISALASNGVVGVAFALLVTYVFKLHSELRQEQSGRIEDIKEYAKLASELQQRAHESATLVAQTAEKLSMVIEFLGRRGQ